jgi:hypothetical protein
VVNLLNRIVLFLVIFIFASNSSVQALSWEYPFVVWKGKVYRVTDETMTSSQVKKSIGGVETKPNEMTGNYYGNASNSYPIGTGYYEIIGVHYDNAIAVRVENRKWLKAVYTQKAPFHLMNYISKPYLYLVAGLVISLLQNRINKKALPKLM